METKDILKRLRKDKKITANQLSKIFEMEESTISEIERGKRNLTINLLKKYCEYFQQPADYILQLSNKTPNIIYEDENIILYNSKIYMNIEFDLLHEYKIKFKKENWSTIAQHISISFIYDTYFTKCEEYTDDYTTTDSTENKYYKNDETIITQLTDYNHFHYNNINYIPFSIRNVDLKILKVSKTREELKEEQENEFK